MKKAIFSLVLILGICMSVLFQAVAEVSIDQMTLDELLELEGKIQDKIYELDAAANCIVYPGIYEIGKDLEPATYLLRCVEVYSRTSVAIAIQDTGSGTLIPYESIVGESCQVTLEEGHKLVIKNGVFTFIKR